MSTIASSASAQAVLQNPSCEEEFGGSVAQDILFDTGRIELNSRTMSDGCFCLGNAQAVNRFLATSHYAALMPLIPEEELYASSVQHPRHPEMTWLLHTRRVPCITAEQAQTLGFTVPRSGAAKPTMTEPDGKILDLRCAGVGDMDATVWCCMDCINNLCREEKRDLNATSSACEPSLARPRTPAVPEGFGGRPDAQLFRPPCLAKIDFGKGRQRRVGERHRRQLHSLGAKQTPRLRSISTAHDPGVAGIVRRSLLPQS